MKRAWIKSTIFNFLFYGITAILCLAYLPLLLLPRSWFMGAVKFWLYVVLILEKYVLGLTYEIRGAHHVPESGPFLIAAKHQSAYETLKLHFLFKDPAIILKKELLNIPLWGFYLRKSNPIAINRSTPEQALKSIEDGAIRIAEQGRPIVIFPQGTRVQADTTTRDKPYKAGIARVQQATNLPIIPLALNSGLFWPRSGWLKSPGKIIFEFLPPIPPGKERKELMSDLEGQIENQSSSLMSEALIEAAEKKQTQAKPYFITLALVITLLGLYSLTWFKTAESIQKNYVTVINDISETKTASTPYISGFPGPIKAHVKKETIANKNGSLTIHDLQATGWPIPGLPVDIKTGPLQIMDMKWKEPLTFDSLQASIKVRNKELEIIESALKQDRFQAGISGTADLAREPVPKMNLAITLQNHQSLLIKLQQKEIIETRAALFVGAGLSALADDKGVVRVPLKQRGRSLYAGPLQVLKLPEASPPARRRLVPDNRPVQVQ